MIPKVLIPERAIKHFQDNIRRILSPSTTNDSAKAKVTAVNRVIRGWCAYYRCTNSPSVIFRKVENEIFSGDGPLAGRKSKLKSMPEIMRRYRKGNTFLYKSLLLEKPSKYTAKRFEPAHGTTPIPRQSKSEQKKTGLNGKVCSPTTTPGSERKETWNDGPTRSNSSPRRASVRNVSGHIPTL